MHPVRRQGPRNNRVCSWTRLPDDGFVSISIHRLGSCLRFALGSRDLNAKRKQRAAQRIAPATLLFGSSSSILVTMTSVVSIKPAMLAALVRADLVTRVGSTMPAL